MIRAGWLPLVLLLAACGSNAVDSSSVFPWIQPPPMETAQGIVNDETPQDTPELKARAAEERETLPSAPTPADADYFYGLGSVPPRPTMPTIAEITGDANALDVEQQAQMAKIAIQAGAPLPETLPKPNAAGTPAGTPAAAPATEGPTMTQARTGVMSGVDTMTMSGDNSAFLPQSETVEATDLMPPQDR